MTTVRYNLSDLFPNQSTAYLNNNTPFVISGSFYNLGNNVIITKAIISLSMSGWTNNLINLYYLDGNDEVFIDRISDNNGIGVFDFTRYLYLNKNYISNLIIKADNPLILASIFLTSSNSFIEIEYTTLDECRPSEESLKNDINYSISYKFNYATRNLKVRKKLFNKILPYDVSIYFDNLRSDCEHLLFPKGWKINLLDYLDITIDNLGNKEIVYYDPYNNSHKLYPLLSNDANNPIILAYYSKDGTALILEEESIENELFYKLSTKIGNSYKRFDSTGRIIKIQGAKTKEVINIDYDNGIEIEDYRGNTINISSSGSTISISLNNEFFYTLNISASNQLQSVSTNNIYDSFSYNSSGKITNISHDSETIFTIQYFNDSVSEMIECKGNNVLEHYYISYDYFKTYILNRHNVKYYFYFDSSLKLISKGETIDGVDDVSILDTHEIEVEDAYFMFANSEINKYEDENENTEFSLNTVSNSLEYKQLFSFAAAFSSFEADKKYILVATLTKNINSNVALSSSREIYIIFDYMIDTIRFDFDPYLQKQRIAIPFVVDSGAMIHTIKVYAKGMYDFGGVTISDVMIVCPSKKATTYYANKTNDNNLSLQSGASPITVDGKNWYRINEIVNNGDLTIKYNFNELKRNYVALIGGSSYFWGNDFSTLVYGESINNSEPEFNFKGCLISPSTLESATYYGKKTLISEGIFSDNYYFESLRFDSMHNCFEYVKFYKLNISTTCKFVKKYDLNLRLIEETDYKGVTKTYTYDLDGNLIKTRTKHDNGTKYIDSDFVYDTLLRNTIENNGVSSKNYLYLDEYDLIEQITDSNNDAESYEYNNELNAITSVSKGTSEISNTYDSNNLLTKTSNDSDINILYDNYGLESSATVLQNNTTKSLFNLSRTFGAEDKIEKNGLIHNYNKYGLIKNISIIRAQVETSKCDFYYSIDTPSNFLTINIQDASELTSQSKLCVINDDFSKRRSHYKYNSSGKLTDLEVNDFVYNGFSFFYNWKFEYDGQERLSGKYYCLSNNLIFNSLYICQTSYSYIDNLSELIGSVTNIVGSQLYSGTLGKTKVDYYYDDLPRPIKTVHTIYIRDNNNWVVSHKHRSIYNYRDLSTTRTTSLISRIDFSYYHDSWQNLKSIYYNYDNLGRISSIRYGTTTNENSNSGVSYSYDNCDRVTSENNIELGKTINYNYDNNGNIISAVKTQIGNPNNVETDYYQYDTTYKDLLVSFNGNQITYDDKLRPVSYKNDTFFNWQNNQLLSITINGNNQFSRTCFWYGYDGIRTKKISPDGTEHIYILDGKRIAGEKVINPDDSVYCITYLYDTNGVYGITYKNKYFTFKRNLLGDIEYIYSAKNLIARYIYDAYGNCKIVDKNGNEITDLTNVAHINPFRYRGYYFDEETGLYYCNSRYYNPLWRRWISPDDFSNIEIDTTDGINLYAYCKNNPIKYIDPDGSFELITALVGMVVGAVLAIVAVAVSDAISGNDFDWRKYLIAALFGAISGFLTGGFGPGLLSAGINASCSLLQNGIENYVVGNYKNFEDIIGKAFISSAFAFISSLILGIMPFNKIDSLSKSGVAAVMLANNLKKIVPQTLSFVKIIAIQFIKETILFVFEIPFKKAEERTIELFYE